MTAHPIDTEALRDADFLHPALLRTATLHLAPTATQGEAFAAGALYGRERFEDRERLAAAEHRATRAEAQSEARRINAEYWKDLARGRWARIKAVADICDLSAEDAEDMAAISAHYASGYEIALQDIRRALDGTVPPPAE